MDKRTFGEELAFLRRRKGWTQTELAKRVGLSVASIGFYEQGRMRPTPRNLIKLAQVLDVDPEYLFNIAEKDEKKGNKKIIDIKQVQPEWVINPIKFLNNEKSFGKILAFLRKQKLLKQSELADKIGVTRTLISTYEHGKTVPKPETIRKIAEVLGADFATLLRKAESQKYEKSNNKTLVDVSDIVTLPVLKRVCTENSNISNKEIVDTIKLPRRIAHQADYVLLVEKMSMKEVGIFPGDMILVKMQNDADDGQIVIVRANDEFFLKQLRKIEPPSEIVGRVVFLLKEFK